MGKVNKEDIALRKKLRKEIGREDIRGVKSLLIVAGLANALLITMTVFGIYFWVTRDETPGQKACTEEAKKCPDGSYVGHTGPNCRFAPCPTIKPSVTPTRPPIR